jgi:arylsulfatase A-like enzyme
MLLLAAVVAGLQAASGAGGQREPAQSPAPTVRPNILLVVLDDMGYGDASCYGSRDLQTPAIDRMAREGIRFTRFRVNPLCAPTRASLLTGLYSLETGMWRGPEGRGRASRAAPDGRTRPRALRDDIQLLPRYLKEAGYVTGLFGKWHLGEEPANSPNARGFDEFVGFLGGAHPYGLDRNSRMLHNGEPLQVTGHTTDLFADRAVAFVRANADRPFFCYVPFNAVHGPLRSADRNADSARSDWLATYERAGVPQPRRDYGAVLSHADARIGELLETLGELDLADRTLVIVLSDNGGILHTYPSDNGPLRGGKGNTFEGGLRVPAVMRWPGQIPPGSVSEADAMHFDLFSTILDAAGLPVPERNGPFAVSGVSLLPHVRSGGRTSLPDRYLFWDLYGQVGGLHGPWKLVGEISNHRGRFEQAVSEAASTRFALYHLSEDPSEQTDVSGTYPAIYEDLKGRHLDWLRRMAN